jgi:hypothetical protein
VDAAIEAPVSEVDHSSVDNPVEDVSRTWSPEQIVSGPFAVIVGVAGTGFSVTFTAAEGAEGHPEALAVTVNVPGALTVMDGVVAPVDQRLLLPEDVSTVLSPGQMPKDGLAVITGAGGVASMVTVVGALVAEQPFPFV